VLPFAFIVCRVGIGVLDTEALAVEVVELGSLFASSVRIEFNDFEVLDEVGAVLG
jgi:hypothetical protein